MTGPIVILKNHYTVTVRNKFDTLQKTSERHILNDKYENFVITYIECIPIKPRTK